MTQIQTKLAEIIAQVASQELEIEVAPDLVVLNHPADSNHGDWATNLALQLFSQAETSDVGKSPRELAQKLVSKLVENEELAQSIDKIEVAGPGFINFYLSEAFLTGQIQEILQTTGNFSFEALKDQNVMVEYTDPNPFKVFHIGHLFSNIVGESLARLHERASANVYRVCYQGDVGMHVAKSLWGLIKILDEDRVTFNELATKDLDDRVAYLGRGYAAGAKAFKDDEAAQLEIKQINLMAFKAGQAVLAETSPEEVHLDYDKYLDQLGKSKFEYSMIKDYYQQGRAWSLEYFEQVYGRLAKKSKYSKFDNDKYFMNYFFESLTAEYGYPLVLDGLEKGIFEKSKGAIIFPGEKYGLHNRVFINSLGLPTYEGKDLGLMMTKDKWLKKEHGVDLDKSIIVTGNEIVDYFKVVLEAAKQIDPAIPAKTFHVSHGMVRLPEGKMSSRTGNIIGGVDLLDSVKDAALEVINDSEQDKGSLATADSATLAEKISKSAIKYAFLKSNTTKDVIFSKEEALSFTGNSGPYIQYTFVRCVSVLDKLNQDLGSESLTTIAKQFDTLLNSKVGVVGQAEQDLLRYIYKYNDAIRLATTELAPHYVSTFIFELSQLYNTYYGVNKIVGSGPDKEPLRVAITAAVALVLADGLDVLGIEAVERM